MTRLLLVRHARSTANAAGVLAGHSPGVGLDDEGRRQALRLAERFAGVPVAEIIASPLDRCVQTAAALAGLAGAPAVRLEPRVLECDYGDWTGQPLRDLVSLPLWAQVQSEPSTVVFPGGEAMTDFFERVIAGIGDLEAQVAHEHGPGAVWVVVTHADVVKAVLAGALGLPLDRFQRLAVAPASVSVVSYGLQFPVVTAMNSGSRPLRDLLGDSPVVVPGGGTGSPSA